MYVNIIIYTHVIYIYRRARARALHHISVHHIEYKKEIGTKTFGMSPLFFLYKLEYNLGLNLIKLMRVYVHKYRRSYSLDEN